MIRMIGTAPYHVPAVAYEPDVRASIRNQDPSAWLSFGRMHDGEFITVGQMAPGEEVSMALRDPLYLRVDEREGTAVLATITWT